MRPPLTSSTSEGAQEIQNTGSADFQLLENWEEQFF